MINVALIGFGSVAQNLHLPLIKSHPNLKITQVCSSKPELVGKYLPDAQCFDSPGKLLAQPDADLIVVATPNEFHCAIARQAIKAARNVVLEKPVALNVKDVQELQHLAEAHGVQIFGFHNRRWDGDFLTVAHLLAERRLGDIKRFETHFDRFRPAPRSKWKEQPGPGSGLWFDIAPHLLDQALYLFGSPEAITARILAIRPDSQTDDYFHVQLHYPDKEVILSASNLNAAPVQRYQIQGTKGTFVKMGMDVQEAQLQASMSPENPQYGMDDEENHGILYTVDESENSIQQIVPTHRGDYLQFYQNVVTAIQNQAPGPVSIKSVTEVVRFLQLGLLSQKQGKTITVRQYRDE